MSLIFQLGNICHIFYILLYYFYFSLNRISFWIFSYFLKFDTKYGRGRKLNHNLRPLTIPRNLLNWKREEVGTAQAIVWGERIIRSGQNVLWREKLDWDQISKYNRWSYWIFSQTRSFIHRKITEDVLSSSRKSSSFAL